MHSHNRVFLPAIAALACAAAIPARAANAVSDDDARRRHEARFRFGPEPSHHHQSTGLQRMLRKAKRRG